MSSMRWPLWTDAVGPVPSFYTVSNYWNSMEGYVYRDHWRSTFQFQELKWPSIPKYSIYSTGLSTYSQMIRIDISVRAFAKDKIFLHRIIRVCLIRIIFSAPRPPIKDPRKEGNILTSDFTILGTTFALNRWAYTTFPGKTLRTFYPSRTHRHKPLIK